MMADNIRKEFDANVLALYNKKDCSSSHLTSDRYKWIVARLQELKRNPAVKKEARDYRIVKTYEIKSVIMHDIYVDKLQKKGTNLLYVSHEELYDAIHDIHLSTNHGARDIMHDRAKKMYANITKELLQLYVDLCQDCHLKKSRVRRYSEIKPSNTPASNCRGQIDIIDMTLQPDGRYNFIMCYQYLLTKFICLKPLRTQQPTEVANCLVDIFCTFGSPYIIQSSNGRMFAEKIVKEVKRIWPECDLVHGNIRPLEDLDLLKGHHQDVEFLLACWMKDNNTNRWSSGLRFIQWQKNKSDNDDMKKSPYMAMFCNTAKLGINSTEFTQETLTNLESEEDLTVAWNLKNKIKKEKENSVSFSDNPNPDVKSSYLAEISSAICPEIYPEMLPSGDAIQQNFSASSHLDNLAKPCIQYDTTCFVCKSPYNGNFKCILCNNACHEKPPCALAITLDSGLDIAVCSICQTSKGSHSKLNAEEEDRKVKINTVNSSKAPQPRESVLVPLEDFSRRENRNMERNENFNARINYNTVYGNNNDASKSSKNTFSWLNAKYGDALDALQRMMYQNHTWTNIPLDKLTEMPRNDLEEQCYSKYSSY